MGPSEGTPQNADNSPHYSALLWFIFLWRSIDFLLFSLPLIPGSVSSVVLHRGAIIQSLITAPLAAYLFPGDSLFKPLPNDLGKLTCSTSQGCGASLMSQGWPPMQGLLVRSKKVRAGPSTSSWLYSCISCRIQTTNWAQHAEGSPLWGTLFIHMKMRASKFSSFTGVPEWVWTRELWFRHLCDHKLKKNL